MRFNKIYAVPSDFRVKAEQYESLVIDPAQAESKAAEGLAICIRAENEPEYTFLDYDTKNGKNGYALLQEHKEAYPEVFSQTMRYTTKTPQSARVVIKRLHRNTSVHPYSATEYGDALEVFDQDTNKGRWIVIPPTHGYGQWQGTSVLQAPTALEDDFLRHAAQKPVGSRTARNTDVPDYLTNWTPKRVKVQMPRQRQTYGTGRKKRTLCDCFSASVSVKVMGEDGESKSSWVDTNRHSEMWHYLNMHFKEYFDSDKFVGKPVLNQAFTILSALNDKWQCADCSPKFTDDNQVKQDIVRFLVQYDFNYPDSNIVSRPITRIPGSMYFHESPHSFNVVGYTEHRKSAFTGSHILRDWHTNVGGTVIWLSDDEKASDIMSKTQGHVYAYSSLDTEEGASRYVFEDGTSDIVGSIHRAAEMAEDQGADLDKPWLLIIDPMTAFQKMNTANGFNKIVDEYNRVYAIQGQIGREFPNAYSIYLLHSNEESKDSTGGKAFGSMGWQAKTRFWVKCRNTDTEIAKGGTVTIGGNWTAGETTYDMDLSNFPDIELKPYKTVTDPLVKALADLNNNGSTDQTALLPRIKALGLDVHIEGKTIVRGKTPETEAYVDEDGDAVWGNKQVAS